MTQEIRCPTCGNVLASDQLIPGQTVRCPLCSAQFMLPADSPAQRTSGKAVTSFVLGIVSLLGICLTGIPAIVLGIIALSDIRRHAGRLTGRGWAIGGIVTGGVFGMLCGPVAWVVVLLAMAFQGIGFELTHDPQQVQAIADKIGTFKLPDGLQPRSGMDLGILGMKMAAFTDRPGQPNSMLMLMQFPQMLSANRQEMEQSFQQQARQQGMYAHFQTEATKQLTFTVRGEEVEVTEAIGRNTDSGQPARQYTAFLPAQTGPVMVMIITQDLPADQPAPAQGEEPGITLSDDQVREFFESFQ